MASLREGMTQGCKISCWKLRNSELRIFNYLLRSEDNITVISDNYLSSPSSEYRDFFQTYTRSLQNFGTNQGTFDKISSLPSIFFPKQSLPENTPMLTSFSNRRLKWCHHAALKIDALTETHLLYSWRRTRTSRSRPPTTGNGCSQQKR